MSIGPEDRSEGLVVQERTSDGGSRNSLMSNGKDKFCNYCKKKGHVKT